MERSTFVSGRMTIPIPVERWHFRIPGLCIHDRVRALHSSHYALEGLDSEIILSVI